VIRRARPEDADAIAGLFERSFGTLTFVPVLHTLEEHRAFFGRLIVEEEVWVAEPDGVVAGFLVLSERMIHHLYVEPERIGSGIGTALLDHAKARRPDGFTLWTFQENVRARHFYERHGLVAVLLTDGEDNQERTPDVLYEWKRPLRSGQERRTL
jgi:ribosomal protein S18 acetylase RimI-like enzyme